MDLCMTSDYASGTGDPEPYLRRIADAGFTHVHWCHQWSTDFLYSKHEVEQIARWLDAFGLRLLDLHASCGREKRWTSPKTYERLAGCELVENRIDMTARLGADVIIMHIGERPEDEAAADALWDRLRRSLDRLEPYARKRSVRIAVENMGRDDFALIERVFAAYGPDYVGLCYDSGHGNMGGEGLAHLEAVKHRLLSVHLHDNDGSGDQHLLPFDGSVDWERLTDLLASSSYEKCLSLEISMRGYEGEEESAVLRRAWERGRRLTEMAAERLPRG